jgi:hypothetical protein
VALVGGQETSQPAALAAKARTPEAAATAETPAKKRTSSARRPSRTPQGSLAASSGQRGDDGAGGEELAGSEEVGGDRGGGDSDSDSDSDSEAANNAHLAAALFPSPGWDSGGCAGLLVGSGGQGVSPLSSFPSPLPPSPLPSGGDVGGGGGVVAASLTAVDLSAVSLNLSGDNSRSGGVLAGRGSGFGGALFRDRHGSSDSRERAFDLEVSSSELFSRSPTPARGGGEGGGDSGGATGAAVRARGTVAALAARFEAGAVGTNLAAAAVDGAALAAADVSAYDLQRDGALLSPPPADAHNSSLGSLEYSRSPAGLAAAALRVESGSSSGAVETGAAGSAEADGGELLLLPQTPGGARRPLSGFGARHSLALPRQAPAVLAASAASAATAGAREAAAGGRESPGALTTADAYFAAVARALKPSPSQSISRSGVGTPATGLVGAFGVLDAQYAAVRKVAAELDAVALAVEACDAVRLELAHYTHKVLVVFAPRALASLF